jgi:hypothetical protein
MYGNARRALADTKPSGCPKPDDDTGANDRSAVSDGRAPPE